MPLRSVKRGVKGKEGCHEHIHVTFKMKRYGTQKVNGKDQSNGCGTRQTILPAQPNHPIVPSNIVFIRTPFGDLTVGSIAYTHTILVMVGQY